MKIRLEVVLHLVFLTPFDLGPDAFVEEHKGGLEDSVGSGDLRSNTKVLGDENGHGQSVADGEKSPNEYTSHITRTHPPGTSFEYA